MKTALSIAGSDPSGGAGIQADIKTMTVHGVYAMSCVTALTAQNTLGVKGFIACEPSFLADQLDCVFSDIFPDAVKTGMLASAELIEVAAEKLEQYGASRIVADPVMVSASGDSLIAPDAVDALKARIFPLAALITPNIPEAESLAGVKIHNKEDMEAAALSLFAMFGAAVLLKGGHSVSDADDLLCAEGKLVWLKGERVQTSNTHGTGCTLSSAIAANLAKGFSLELSARRAKDYISGALAAMLNLGKGCGPVCHAFNLQGSPFFEEA